MRCGASWLVCGVLVVARLDAQALEPRWSIAATASSFFAHQAIAAQRDLTGSWIGAGLEGEWRMLSLSVEGVTGTISGGGDQRRVRVTDAALRVRPRSWLTLGVAAEALRSAETGDTSVWRMVGPLAGVTLPLGVDGLDARGEVAFFPFLGVAGIDPLSRVARAEIGLTYAPSHWPVSVGLDYRRQSFSFGDARASESLGGLVLSVRARVLAK